VGTVQTPGATASEDKVAASRRLPQARGFSRVYAPRLPAHLESAHQPWGGVENDGLVVARRPFCSTLNELDA
jgi:hypothetical protein